MKLRNLLSDASQSFRDRFGRSRTTSSASGGATQVDTSAFTGTRHQRASVDDTASRTHCAPSVSQCIQPDSSLGTAVTAERHVDRSETVATGSNLSADPTSDTPSAGYPGASNTDTGAPKVDPEQSSRTDFQDLMARPYRNRDEVQNPEMSEDGIGRLRDTVRSHVKAYRNGVNPMMDLITNEDKATSSRSMLSKAALRTENAARAEASHKSSIVKTEFGLAYDTLTDVEKSIIEAGIDEGHLARTKYADHVPIATRRRQFNEHWVDEVEKARAETIRRLQAEEAAQKKAQMAEKAEKAGEATEDGNVELPGPSVTVTEAEACD
ncbi:hypothetical protein IAT40_004100 [Kwoniella sp. CBS 6097]